MSDATVFDEIFTRLTPDRIFKDPRATGEGVSVAVIDSGVELVVLEDPGDEDDPGRKVRATVREGTYKGRTYLEFKEKTPRAREG